jgi:hypothetical protein
VANLKWNIPTSCRGVHDGHLYIAHKGLTHF